MSIKTHHENNFSTLCRAVREGNVCLMLCTDAKTGEDAVVICMVNQTEDGGHFDLVPVATMIEGNPYEAYIPPGDDNINDTETDNEPAKANSVSTTSKGETA